MALHSASCKFSICETTLACLTAAALFLGFSLNKEAQRCQRFCCIDHACHEAAQQQDSCLQGGQSTSKEVIV
jgi:hypothetical protein